MDKLEYLEMNDYADYNKAIVFIHGWTGGWEVWKPVINEFNSNKIYAVDLPGHNKSDRPRHAAAYTYLSGSFGFLVVPFNLD